MLQAFSNLRRVLHRLRRNPIESDLGSYQYLLGRINQRGREIETVEDAVLDRLSSDLVSEARNGLSLDGLLVETFTLVREASRRMLGLRHFDVQILAGIALHQGKLVEMQTGEGKTLAAVLPACLSAMAGRHVHVLTFNDYLARRDASWMGPVYQRLGLTVGCVQQGMTTKERQKAYGCDVTYLTAKEAGFDHLRDHLCVRGADVVHRPLCCAIVDEADSILIDEARIPLVIAGAMPVPETRLREMIELVRRLDADVDFDTDEYQRNIYLTEAGVERVEHLLDCDNLYGLENLSLLIDLNLALQAERLLHRDVDYIVRDGRVEHVDEFTGRIAENRRWPKGLQAAIEAKEGLAIQPEGTILGSITLMHFLGEYAQVCGMTATARSAAEEFKTFYGLDTVVIPPNSPCIRIDHPDVVFTHKEAKTKALIEEITQAHGTGRPVLVGTISVKESEQLAGALVQADVPCQVLNAKNDELEAQIIAQAGSLGAVTISTNMAGRGTDIRLGGADERNRDRVVELGGLYVVGTNRHESLRIDNQLRGRAGRQGDPGSSRFFVSLEDDLIKQYGVQELIPASHRPLRQHGPIQDRVVANEIARAQRIIEGQNFEIRKTLWRYSSLVDEQRRNVYRRREDVLLDRKPLTLLATGSPERYAQLQAGVGEDVLRNVEKRVTLFHIDQSWADHLALVDQIREGIHLFGMEGNGLLDKIHLSRFAVVNPLDEFNRQVITAFLRLLRRIDDKVVKTLNCAEITGKGIDMDAQGLKAPSATWTYLINDTPFGDWNIFEALKSRIKEALTRDRD